jgi:hypothetical protein
VLIFASALRNALKVEEDILLTDKQRAQTAARQQRFRERQAQMRRVEQAAKGLPALPAIASIPGQARWRNSLASAHLLIAQVQEEMEAYYADRSEAWQESERGEEFVQRQEGIEAVLSQLEPLLE